jgi:hypothetical protein
VADITLTTGSGPGGLSVEEQSANEQWIQKNR